MPSIRLWQTSNASSRLGYSDVNSVLIILVAYCGVADVRMILEIVL